MGKYCELEGVRRILLRGAQEGDEVGEILRRELLFESGGHDGDRSGADLFDFVTRDAYFFEGVDFEDHFLGTVGFEDPAVDLAGGGGDGDGFVAADETGTGEDDRFEEIAFVADLSDASEVGADISSAIADGVAGEAGGFGAVEDSMSATDVAVFQIDQELFEAFALSAGAFGQFFEDGVGEFAKFGSVRLERFFDEFGAEGGESRGGFQSGDQMLADFGIGGLFEGGDETFDFEGTGDGDRGGENLKLLRLQGDARKDVGDGEPNRNRSFGSEVLNEQIESCGVEAGKTGGRSGEGFDAGGGGSFRVAGSIQEGGLEVGRERLVGNERTRGSDGCCCEFGFRRSDCVREGSDPGSGDRTKSGIGKKPDEFESLGSGEIGGIDPDSDELLDEGIFGKLREQLNEFGLLGGGGLFGEESLMKEGGELCSPVGVTINEPEGGGIEDGIGADEERGDRSRIETASGHLIERDEGGADRSGIGGGESRASEVGLAEFDERVGDGVFENAVVGNGCRGGEKKGDDGGGVEASEGFGGGTFIVRRI